MNVMVIDSYVERWREVQREANLSYDCHCNRIFSPRIIRSLYSSAYMPYSDYAAHLSITTTGWSRKDLPLVYERLQLVFHHCDFLDHTSLSLSPSQPFLARSCRERAGGGIKRLQ